MPPDTARVQDAALARFDRLQSKEDKARKQYELDKGKSDATLKRLAAKAATDAAAQKALDDVQGGKGDQKDGNPARGPIQGGKGMGPHKKNPVGDKSVKEAARFSKKLAAESKKNQLPPSTAGVNEAPPAQVTSGGDLGQNLGQQPPATAPASVPATGSSVDIAKDTTNSPPSKFAAKIGETGKNITGAATTEVQAQNSSAPVFNATMVGAPKGPLDLKKAQADKKLDVDRGDKAKAPTLRKETRIRAVKGKPGSDIKGAGDAGADALKALFSASLSKIDTQSTTNTSPGPAPTVQLQGEADPARGNEAMDEAKEKSDAAYVKHVEAIEAGPGPEVVQPQDMQEEVKPELAELPQIPDVPTPDQATEYLAKGHDQAVYDKADELKAADFDTSLAEAEAKFEEANTSLETDHAAKLEEASSAVDEENKKAQEKQEAEVTAARADIDEGRKGTKKAQEEELKKAKKKGDAEKKATQKKIEKRRKDDDRKIAKKYKEGEKKAEAKKKAAEKKAAAEKKKAESKKEDQSWWDRAASAVGSFIDTIASAVTTIFDAMAKAVGDILNAVKDAAMGMIDAAMSFATSALDVLGDALKSMVTNLIGDVFPGLAAALNDLIDSAVDAAKGAIEAIGEQLKAAVAAAIDALNSGIQAVINAYKTAISTALAIASAAVSGDWEAVFKAMLEGALSIAGVDPAQFYQLVGEGMDTINAIIDDPGSFVGNMIDAVGQGFGQFADNFGSHLLNGAVEWLTGSLGEAGITLPETWDAAGIFGMIADILGVSWDGLKGKIGERIGEDNVAMLESIWGYVEAAMNGGIAGLWDHAKDQLGDLWQGLLDSALAMLTEQIVTAAIMKIATMWNPAGAIVQALITVWNVYNFVQEQAQRIMGLVTSVVDSMSNIVAGQLGQAANFIEGSLADLVPVAISLLANLLGLGGISKKVKGIIDKIQEQVDKAIDWVLDKLFELGKAAFDALKGKLGGKDDPAAEQKAAEEQPEPETPVGGDPAQLPRLTLATTQGGMPLDWDAERGGQGASVKLTSGPYSGKLGAEGIGKLEAAAGALQGPAKTEADRYIGSAKTSVLSVDSRGGKFIRGEETDLAALKSAYDTLAAALLEGINVLDSANATGLEADALPAPATFTDAHGHNHRLWAESEGGVTKLMVASTPIRVQDQVRAWRDIVKKMVEPDKGNLKRLIDEAITLEQAAETLAAEVAAGRGDASALASKQTDLGTLLDSIFSVTSATGDFAGIDPRDMLLDPMYTDFKGRFVALASEIGLANGESEAERIWLLTVSTIQQTMPTYRSVKELTPKPREYKRQLGSETMKKVIEEFEPMVAAMRPIMDLWVQQNAGKDWAFWSGKPAKEVATGASGWVALESSPLGALFDNLNIDGAWAMQMWGSLSNAYAEYLAKAVGEGVDLAGFVGMGSTGVENTYMAIERKAVARMLGHHAAANLDFTWYSCLSVSGNVNQPDTTKKVDGIEGVFFKSKDRNAAITQAETEGRKIHPWGDAPHTDLLKHLQENRFASASFDSNLMAKLATVTPPDKPDEGIDVSEQYVRHNRPTLDTLFVRNSSVGQSLSTDLETITESKNMGDWVDQRGFAPDSPYVGELKKAVKADLATSVRSPVIRDSVLQTANPKLPGGAKSAIRTWLKTQPSRGAPPPTRTTGDLPKHSYSNAGGESHELYVDPGSNDVTQASNNPKKVASSQQGSTASLAARVDGLTRRYLSGDDVLEEIKTLMAQLESQLAGQPREVPEDKQQPQGRDPSGLPNGSANTSAGKLDLAWDAAFGGPKASLSVSGGAFAGAVAGAGGDKLAAEIALMEGTRKADAQRSLEVARTQALAAETKAGAYLRGEELPASQVSESMLLVSRALESGGNALGDETGGDKKKSVADHEKLAADAKAELEKDQAVKDLAEARQVKEAAADQQKAAIQPKLEPDVQITITFGSKADDEKDESIDVEILIAPNDTTLKATWKWVKSLVGGGDLDRNARWQIEGFSGTIHVLMIKATDLGGFEYAEKQIENFDKEITALEGKSWAKKALSDAQDPHPGGAAMAEMLKVVEKDFVQWYAELGKQALAAATGKDPKEALAAVVKLQQEWAAPLGTLAGALQAIEVNSPLVAKQLAALQGGKLLDAAVFGDAPRTAVIDAIDSHFAKQIFERLDPIGKATSGGELAGAVAELQKYIAANSDLGAYGVDMTIFGDTRGKLTNLEQGLTAMVEGTFTSEALKAAAGKDPVEALAAVVELQNTWGTNLDKGVLALEAMEFKPTALKDLTASLKTKNALPGGSLAAKRKELIELIDPAFAAKVKAAVEKVGEAKDIGGLAAATAAVHKLLADQESVAGFGVDLKELTQTVGALAPLDALLAAKLYEVLDGWVQGQAGSAAEVLGKVLPEQKKVFDAQAPLIALVKKLGASLSKTDALGGQASSKLWRPASGDPYPSIADRFDKEAKALAAKASQIAPTGKDPKSGHKALLDFAQEYETFLEVHKTELVTRTEYYKKGLAHFQQTTDVVYAQVIAMADHWAKQDDLKIDKTGMLPTFFASVMKAQKLTMGPITTIVTASAGWTLPLSNDLVALKTAAADGQMWEMYKKDILEQDQYLGQLHKDGKIVDDAALILQIGKDRSAKTKAKIKDWGFDPMVQEGPIKTLLPVIDRIVAQEREMVLLGQDLLRFVGPEALDAERAGALIKAAKAESEATWTKAVTAPVKLAIKSFEATIASLALLVPSSDKTVLEKRKDTLWAEVKQALLDTTAGLGSVLSALGGASIAKKVLGTLAEGLRALDTEQRSKFDKNVDKALEGFSVAMGTEKKDGVPAKGKDSSKGLNVSGAVLSAISFGALFAGGLAGMPVLGATVGSILGLLGVALTNRASNKDKKEWKKPALKGAGHVAGIWAAAGTIMGFAALGITGWIPLAMAGSALVGSILKALSSGAASNKDSLQKRLAKQSEVFEQNQIKLPVDIAKMKTELEKVDAKQT